MKRLLPILLLIPNVVFSKEINLSCERLYSETYQKGIKTDTKKGVGQTYLMKIKDNTFIVDKMSIPISKITEDYYYYFKKGTEWKTLYFDMEPGDYQMRLNRKTGILEQWANYGYSDMNRRYALIKVNKCELAKNIF